MGTRRRPQTRAWKNVPPSPVAAVAAVVVGKVVETRPRLPRPRTTSRKQRVTEREKGAKARPRRAVHPVAVLPGEGVLGLPLPPKPMPSPKLPRMERKRPRQRVVVGRLVEADRPRSQSPRAQDLETPPKRLRTPRAPMHRAPHLVAVPLVGGALLRRRRTRSARARLGVGLAKVDRPRLEHGRVGLGTETWRRLRRRTGLSRTAIAPGAIKAEARPIAPLRSERAISLGRQRDRPS